jgi:UDP-GlcNAc:undecaprenyl-phosphate GlcNAc-1-phosphate transferase
MLLGGNPYYALLTAILAGSCAGFLPFNSNPAKIIMGDTGALFLGYTLSVLSVGGVFKMDAVLAFLIPLAIFGLPLFDTTFAVIRRVAHGKSPFAADRGHLHHRLIDMGFGHKQSVRILYSISGTLGIAAVLLMESSFIPAITLVVADLGLYITLYFIMRNKELRKLTGLENIDLHPDDIQSPSEGQ